MLISVLGRLAYPKDALNFFPDGQSTSVYHRFVSLEKQTVEVSLQFQKGARYLFLSGEKSRLSIERLNVSLLTRRLLYDIGIAELLKRNQENDSRPQVVRFGPGDVLMREGNVASRVLFIAKGSCVIFKKPNARGLPAMCVGSLTSPSFIGFAPLVLDNECIRCR